MHDEVSLWGLNTLILNGGSFVLCISMSVTIGMTQKNNLSALRTAQLSSI